MPKNKNNKKNEKGSGHSSLPYRCLLQKLRKASKLSTHRTFDASSSSGPLPFPFNCQLTPSDSTISQLIQGTFKTEYCPLSNGYQAFKEPLIGPYGFGTKKDIPLITLSDDDDNDDTCRSSSKVEFKPNLTTSQDLCIPIQDKDPSTSSHTPVDSTIVSELGQCIGASEKMTKWPVNPKSTNPQNNQSTVSPSVQADPEVTTPISSTPRRLRPIVIDGTNVALAHGQPSNVFSCKGIKICVDYFLTRGHTEVTAFVPQFRRCVSSKRTIGQEILEQLAETQRVVFTPSRRVNGKRICCHYDRFILKLALAKEGIIVSNDSFSHLHRENEMWAETIEKRLLMYCFVGDTLMFPDDPMGGDGPCLADFLSFP